MADNREARRRARAAELREEQIRIRRRKRKRRKIIAARMATLCFLVLLIAGSFFLLVKMVTELRHTEVVTNDFAANIEPQEVVVVNEAEKPIITEDFIPINEFSRPGEVLPEVNNIFVHYTANPGTSAAQNRSYFENLGITGETSASAHFVIGYDGEIIQCIPMNEIAYAVAGRNYDSISIECCYLSADGKFTDDTYQALIRLSAWLLSEYDLTPEDMRRHYDEGGKKCPLYFVEHEDAWEQFLKDLQDYIMREQV
ncbi:MAG: N-acetylmuramoyl-L-alanine amidase [Lachnospiraceae bacterium]|nr:N-acetylmuramoyl-L-alanine amidase [Lachnospiraceae bacterium]